MVENKLRKPKTTTPKRVKSSASNQTIVGLRAEITQLREELATSKRIVAALRPRPETHVEYRARKAARKEAERAKGA